MKNVAIAERKFVQIASLSLTVNGKTFAQQTLMFIAADCSFCPCCSQQRSSPAQHHSFPWHVLHTHFLPLAAISNVLYQKRLATGLNV
jgi:hypothetical protein